MTHNYETKYIEVSLTQVLNYYVEGFNLPEGAKKVGSSGFVDTGRDMVVFKLVLEHPAEIGKSMNTTEGG